MTTELVDAIGSFYSDPLGFVLFAFPWGQKGSVLEYEEGPDQWQIDVLRKIGSGVTSGLPVQIAVASGHGVGKTALTSWIVLWFISTRPHCQIVTTANTEVQLNTKTWRELAKWHKLAINRDWFTWTATKFYQNDNNDTWFASAIPWNEDKPEAFAGTHERDVLLLFDEASAIADPIWETASGAMTTEGAMWCVFGNPTKNTGRFRECWGKFKHRWQTYQVDSRTAKKADKKLLEQWVEDYGEDSDFVRVRVRGVFPRAGSQQFIGNDITDVCRKFKAQGFENQPKILGVDVARYGDDQTVFAIRQGRKAFPLRKYRGLDTMQTADFVREFIKEENPDYVFVDGVGVGGGVIDRLRQLGHDVIEVNSGEKPFDVDNYFNLRAEMWGQMKSWLKQGAELPDDNELYDELTGPEYGYTQHNKIQLERKDDMKKRGLSSPDCADALALTFASGITLPDKYHGRGERYKKKRHNYHTWMAR